MKDFRKEMLRIIFSTSTIRIRTLNVCSVALIVDPVKLAEKQLINKKLKSNNQSLKFFRATL